MKLFETVIDISVIKCNKKNNKNKTKELKLLNYRITNNYIKEKNIDAKKMVENLTKKIPTKELKKEKSLIAFFIILSLSNMITPINLIKKFLEFYDIYVKSINKEYDNDVSFENIWYFGLKYFAFKIIDYKDYDNLKSFDVEILNIDTCLSATYFLKKLKVSEDIIKKKNDEY